MDNQDLKRTYDVFWAWVMVQDSVRGIIIGKSELSKNLYTTDLAKTNRKNPRVVTELIEVHEQVKIDLEGTVDKVPRLENLRKFALDL